MDRFYVITNQLKDTDYRITNEIKEYIEKNGKTCVIAQKDEDGYLIPGTVPKDIQCAIVLGGDRDFNSCCKRIGRISYSITWCKHGNIGISCRGRIA